MRSAARRSSPAWQPSHLPVYYYYLYALVLHSQGLEISKSKNVCPKLLRLGLGNCERVGKAHCVETLNCQWNTLVQERSFPRIGCAKRGSSADFCNEAVSLVWQGTKSLYRHRKNICCYYCYLWLIGNLFSIRQKRRIINRSFFTKFFTPQAISITFSPIKTCHPITQLNKLRNHSQYPSLFARTQNYFLKTLSRVHSLRHYQQNSQLYFYLYSISVFLVFQHVLYLSIILCILIFSWFIYPTAFVTAVRSKRIIIIIINLFYGSGLVPIGIQVQFPLSPIQVVSNNGKSIWSGRNCSCEQENPRLHVGTLESSEGFLANVNSSSCSLYVIVRPSVVCRLSVVCNVRAPYSDDWNFPQCFYAIGYLGHLLTSR